MDDFYGVVFRLALCLLLPIAVIVEQRFVKIEKAPTTEYKLPSFKRDKKEEAMSMVFVVLVLVLVIVTIVCD